VLARYVLLNFVKSSKTHLKNQFGVPEDLATVSALLSSELSLPSTCTPVNTSASQQSDTQAYHVECLSVCALLSLAADKLEHALALNQTQGTGMLSNTHFGLLVSLLTSSLSTRNE
jgi:hypothetical protein